MPWLSPKKGGEGERLQGPNQWREVGNNPIQGMGVTSHFASKWIHKATLMLHEIACGLCKKSGVDAVEDDESHSDFGEDSGDDDSY